MNKNIYIGLSMLASLALTGCQADMDAPGMEVPVATAKANMSILDLKNLCAGETQKIGVLPGTEVLDAEGNPVLDENGNPKGEHIYIHGRVISSDASGNIYKNLVIQDETAALTFSLNQASMYVENRLGQDVVVDMTGLYLGYYRNLQQVGYPSDWNDTYDNLVQLGFMSYDYWIARREFNGLPNEDFKNVSPGGDYPDGNAYYININSKNDLAGVPLEEMQSQLVELHNVSFVDAGKEIFSPYEDNANRTLTFADGTTLTVRNSGYSNFYNQILPEGTGSVRGILSYYGSDWQLVLRDRADVMISTKGQIDDPYTVAEAIRSENATRSGWMTGYIVGSVKAGVSSVTSAADVIFGANAEMDNNLLVADNADETDWQKCICVELPQGSVYREFANLADNPAMYKRQLYFNGRFGTVLGMAGLTNLEGMKPMGTAEGDIPAAAGDGSEANPYNIGYVMKATGEQTEVWVTGYVTGYVKGASWGTAEFSNVGDSSSSNWLNNANVILSEDNPLFSSKSNSIPAGLNNAVKSTLGLYANPSIFGKRVKVKCDVTLDYLGTPGVKKVKEVIVL